MGLGKDIGINTLADTQEEQESLFYLYPEGNCPAKIKLKRHDKLF